MLDPAVAKELHSEKPEAVALQAWRIVLQNIRQYFIEGQSFSIETTLSSASNVEWMRSAKQHGFWVELFYNARVMPKILEYASGEIAWQDSRISNWVTRALDISLE